MVSYELSTPSTVSLGVYDAAGRLLRMLESGARPAGRNQVTWDGTDGAGSRVPQGVCFIRLIGTEPSRCRQWMPRPAV